jgi:hypothetical protein
VATFSLLAKFHQKEKFKNKKSSNFGGFELPKVSSSLDFYP